MSNSVIFGQVVIGSPGAGKTTYCEAMARFLKAIGRDVAIVNILFADIKSFVGHSSSYHCYEPGMKVSEVIYT